MITTPKLRADLSSAPVEDADGVLYYDISDPKSGGVLRLFDFEWHLAQRFDGQRSFDELARWTEEQLGFAASRDDVQVYAERLQQLGLIEGGAGAARSLPGALMASAMLRSLGLLPPATATAAEPAPLVPAKPAEPVVPAKPAEPVVPAKPVEPVVQAAKPAEKPVPAVAPRVEKPAEPPRRVVRDEDEPAMGKPVLAPRLGPPVGTQPKPAAEVKPFEPPKPVAEVKPFEPPRPIAEAKPIVAAPVEVKPAEPILPVAESRSQPESLRSVLEALPPPSEEQTPQPMERPSGVVPQPEKVPEKPAIAEAVSAAITGSPTMPLEAVVGKPGEPTIEKPAVPVGSPTVPLVPVEVQVPVKPTPVEEPRPVVTPTTPTAPTTPVAPVKIEPTKPSERPTAVSAPVPLEKPRSSSAWIFVVVLLLLAVGGAAYYFLVLQKPQAPAAVGVRVTPAQPTDVPRAFPTPVVVKAAEPQPLKLAAAGKVAKVAAEGAAVQPDEVVVQLEAPVKLAKSLDLAKKNLETWKKKLEAARGKPKLERDAQAKVADFEKSVAQIQDQLKPTQLVAPRAGTISKVLVKVRDAVTAGTEAVLFIDKGLGGELKVPALEAQGLKQGQDVQLLGASGPVAAKVASLQTEGDVATLRFALAETATAKAGDELKLAKAPLAQVVRLPSSALLDGTKVFVVQGGVAAVKPVTVADRDGSDALVQGLEPGTKVIVSRVSELHEGTPVQAE